MKKKIKISKEQKENINEISVMADTGMTNGNVQQAVQNAQTNAQRSGVRNVSVVIPPVNETILTKKQVENIKLKIIKENAKTFKKRELTSILLERKKQQMEESFSDLRQMGLFELADSITAAKEQFSGLVNKFFDTLHTKGYKFNDIVNMVNKMQLDGIIPKTMINKIGNEYKNKEKELIKNNKQE